MVKVSVAINTYNSSKYIGDLLESIFEQTVRVDEIVISDDCSSDDTLEKIEDLRFKSSTKIKVLSNDIPIGRPENIEKALSCCGGEVILIAEPKYVWEKDRVEKVLQWFGDNKDKSILLTDINIVCSESSKAISLFEEMGLCRKKLINISVDTFVYSEALFSTIAMTKDWNVRLMPYVKESICVDYGYILLLVAIDKGKIGCINDRTVSFYAGKNVISKKLYPNLSPKNMCENEYRPIYENLSILSPESISRMRFRYDRFGFSGTLVLRNRGKYKKIYVNKSVNIIYHDLLEILKNRFRALFKVSKKRVPSRFRYSKDKYASWLYDLKNNKSLFVPFTKESYKRESSDPKVFAFYLPQFHAIDENDKAHGKGFTEWTNVASCIPQFVGHYQPKIPYDIGFYNLTMHGIMERQCEIAKSYGIYGFCFYYYWFSGRKVLEKPLEYFLKSDIDFHFHFCWANENWSKLWDGGNREVMLEQKLMDGDADKFFDDILPYMKDDRYEKIANKPILIIYRPSLFERCKIRSFLIRLNELARGCGFDGLYILMTNAFGGRNPSDYNMDGMVEFPPHGIDCETVEVDKISIKANYVVYDMDSYIRDEKYIYDVDYQLFKSCFPSWDNLPRKLYSRGGCYLLSDSCFESWLDGVFEWTRENNANDKQYVYINAWNEWGEGAILEPTTRFGYKYLDIVRRCIEKTRKY